MSPETTRRAAALLIEARRECRPLAALPEACRPRTIAEAYAVQDAFVEARGGTLAGFKIGATSQRAREYLDIEGPFYGCMFRDAVHDSPAVLSAGRFIFALVESEFAVRLEADLPARAEPYGRAEVVPARVERGALAIVGVVLDRSTPESFAAFEAAITGLPFILDCHLVAGDFDYFLKIRVRDIADFNRLHGERLIALPGVRQTRTFFVMKEVIDNALLEF